MYVGQTIRTLEIRKAGHQSHGKHAFGAMPIVKAIKKYGKDNFTWFILRNCVSREELDVWEKIYIKLLKTQECGYNIREGGSNTIVAEETKRKISETKKRNPAKPFLGKKHSEETKKKISETKKSRWKPISDELRKQHSKRMMGNKIMVGRKMLPQVRTALLNANTNKVVSEEVKKKISESNKRTYQLKLSEVA